MSATIAASSASMASNAATTAGGTGGMERVVSNVTSVWYILYMNKPLSLPDVNRADRPLPLYEQVKRQISESILTGVLGEGTVLPCETALAAQYGVAVGTIRHALSDLAAEGLLSRRPRTGTAVTGRAPQHSLRFFFHYFRLHAADGRMVQSETEVTALTRTSASAEEAAELAVQPATPVIRVDRIRRVGGHPVMNETMVLSALRLPGFPTRAKDVPSLLYLHLLQEYGLRITAVRESLTADLATPSERRALSLPRPAAVLRIASVAYDQAGRPVLLGRHAATTAGHVYVNEVR
jgi:GntR family transcriptional regulator